MATLRIVNFTKEEMSAIAYNVGNSEEYKGCYYVRRNTFQKKDIKFLLIKLKKLDKFLWKLAAYLDMMKIRKICKNRKYCSE